jgi:hypothetical protein
MSSRFRPLLLLLAAAACGGSDSDRAMDEDVVTERLGPYDVAGSAVTVELTTLRLGDQESVLGMRLLDEAGAAHAAATWDHPAAGASGLETSLSVVPWELEGQSGAALLLVHERLGGLNENRTTVEAYAARDGRLVRLWPPLAAGEVTGLTVDGRGRRHLLDDDRLPLRLGRSHYTMLFPLALDLSCVPGADTCMAVAPAEREPTSGYGVYRVLTQPWPVERAGLVALHTAPGVLPSESVRTAPESRVEVLAVAADADLVRGDVVEIVVRDEWLRVRIDGREGWITGAESYETIGLPALRTRHQN